MALPVRFDDELGFRFRGGRVCLDFVATVGWRHRPVPVERLGTPADLGRWLSAINLTSSRTRPSAADLEQAYELREAIWRLARAVLDGRRFAARDLRTLNSVATAPVRRPALTSDGAVTWVDAGVRGALAEIARDAVALFGSDTSRLKECARPDCSLLFVDDSRAGRRRWCSMEACGNRAKTRAYRRRSAGSAAR
jgi:predicted RNA-binding Zn ribbon-like protein